MTSNQWTTKPTASKRLAFAHNQYNSPLGLYSTEEVAATLQRHTRLLSNGAKGVDFTLLSAPHLVKSEVYKMLSEEETQLVRRNLHQEQITTTMSSTSEMKRVAWPPIPPSTSTNDFNVNETNESHGYKTNIRRNYENPMHYDLAQQQDSFIQTTNDNEMRRTVTFQQEQSEVNQQEELVPPKVPPRVHPKPILRTSSSDQDPLISQGSVESRQSSDLTSSTNEPPKNQEHKSFVRMSSRGVPEPFSSNELVGDRPLIAKPAPPPGLILGRPHRKQAPFLKETPSIRSEPFFKRGNTPVRMLGDMVWPPKSFTESNAQQKVPPLSPGTIRRQQKNYKEFFSQNQLPASFPTYRAPPGTQHFGLEEGENATPM